MRTALGVTLLAALACHIGPSAQNFEPARGPRGIAVDLRVEGRGGRVRGELLELQSGLLLVLRDDKRLVVVPVRAVDFGTFARAGQLIDGGAAHDAERIRLLSRYPAGLSSEVRARLYAAYGQAQPDTVGLVQP